MNARQSIDRLRRITRGMIRPIALHMYWSDQITSIHVDAWQRHAIGARSTDGPRMAIRYLTGQA